MRYVNEENIYICRIALNLTFDLKDIRALGLGTTEIDAPSVCEAGLAMPVGGCMGRAWADGVPVARAL